MPGVGPLVQTASYPALHQNVEIPQYSAHRVSFLIADADENGRLVPRDLTGYNDFSLIRKSSFSAADPAPLYTEADNEVIPVSVGSGEIDVQTATADNALTSVYWYRLQAIDPAGKLVVLIQGNWLIVRN